MVYNTPANFDQKKYESLFLKVQKYVVSLDKDLKNKSWILGNDITLADILSAYILTPLFVL